MPYHLGEGFELEEKTVRPYVLWFEYLKLALDDPKLTVDTEFYAPWGNIRDLQFDDWWEDKGAELFAVPVSVSVIKSSAEAEMALERQDIVVRIAKGTPVREINKKIGKIHKSERTKEAAIELRAQKALFSLKYKKTLSFSHLYAMMRFLTYYRKQKDVDAAAQTYFEWRGDRKKNNKNPKIEKLFLYMPPFISTLVNEIEKHKQAQKGRYRKVPKKDEYNIARSQALRFLRKAEAIVRNVARGEFPGDY